jgi:uncharacterized protein (UPF0332 family)
MKEVLVLAEWRRARQALGSAELLAREGYPADAVTRAYYALFHGAKAVLHVHDVEADTHAAVRRMFGLHLIKPGEIEADWATPLAEGLDERLAADYDPEVSFSAKEARAACRAARAFISRMRRYLLDKGFTRSQLRRSTGRGG